MIVLVGGAWSERVAQIEDVCRNHSIQVITSPEIYGTEFQRSFVDLEHNAGVAMLDVWRWQRDSVAAHIASMQEEAIWSGKKIILATQSLDDLSLMGVQLEGECVTIYMNSDPQWVRQLDVVCDR